MSLEEELVQALFKLRIIILSRGTSWIFFIFFYFRKYCPEQRDVFKLHSSRKYCPEPRNMFEFCLFQGVLTLTEERARAFFFILGSIVLNGGCVRAAFKL